MKKLFNVAVMFAALATALSFTSCETTDEKSETNVNKQQLPELNLTEKNIGQTFDFSSGVVNADGENYSGKFKVTDVNVSENSVTFEITCKATGDRKHEITLSDAGNSYAMVGEEGNIIGAKKAVADAAADQVIFVLLGANRADKTVCTITSGTKNQTLSDNGAKETLFAVKE